jgi:uncharacterized coiled-coil DUF342 family protein
MEKERKLSIKELENLKEQLEYLIRTSSYSPKKKQTLLHQIQGLFKMHVKGASDSQDKPETD